MITAAEFWARVQDALDRRADPLQDAELAGWLELHPEELERYAAWIGALRVVAAMPVQPHVRAPGRRWPWVWVPAAAAAGLLVWVVFSGRSRAPDDGPLPGPRIVAAGAAGIAVLRLEVVQESAPGTRQSCVWTAERSSRQTTRVAPREEGGVRFLEVVISSNGTDRMGAP